MNAKERKKRRRRFRTALAHRGMTQSDFARQQGVSKQHVSNVLGRPSKSARLSDAISRFIEKHYPKQAA